MNEEFNKEIGARIRTQREFLGLTREDICDYVSLSPQFISEIERGRKSPSAMSLYKLCEGLGVSADYILMGKENPPDMSKIVATLSTLEDKHIALAEEMLKTFFKAIKVK